MRRKFPPLTHTVNAPKKGGEKFKEKGGNGEKMKGDEKRNEKKKRKAKKERKKRRKGIKRKEFLRERKGNGKRRQNVQKEKTWGCSSLGDLIFFRERATSL